MTPLVSVVIPVHNRPVSVRRGIESVLAQTCRDLEVIVVDDGSTDGTAAAVASVVDPRVRLIRHQRNRGGSAARNTGIGESSAPYVAFLDSDDEWFPTKLAKQLAVIERADPSVGLVYCGSERVYADGHVERHVPRRRDDLFRALLASNVIGETSVALIRRGVLVAAGGFDESLPSMQDLDLWVRICERYCVDFVAEPLVRISKSDHLTRISVNARATTDGRARYCEKHREQLIKHGVLNQYLRESAWVYLRQAVDPPMARRLYREAIAAKPAAPLTYILLLTACLRVSWLDRMAGYKHTFTTWCRALAARRHARRGRELTSGATS